MNSEKLSQASPSNCTYCYSLNCNIRVESISNVHKQGSITSKSSVLTIGRDLARQIVLQVELGTASGGRPAVASYGLADCVIHQRKISEGKASIEVPERKLVIQLSNCAPRKLNVFLKTVQAKLDIMKSHTNQTKGQYHTPVTIARNKHLRDLPNLHTVLSPLSVDEIRQVKRLRGVADSPLCVPKTTPSRRPNPESTTPKAARKSLLKDVPNKSFGAIQLSDEQRAVVRCVLQSHQNVFFTGSAGTGKSVVLRRIIEMLPAATTYVTAATGVAACQLGGVTLHSFAGIGVGRGTPEQSLAQALSKDIVVKQWKLCTHLVIDEISMIDADFFTKIEYVERHIRGDDRPFGGIQLIITGDFLQLPPVCGRNDTIKFCFECNAWTKSIQKTLLLEKVRRQDDTRFVDVLQQIRFGRCGTEACAALTETQKNNFSTSGIIPTRLCTHTADAAAVNNRCLEELEGPSKVFEAEDSQYIPDSIQCMVPKKLMLKLRTQVMLTKNIDLMRGLSNGSRGVVNKFSKTGYPIVKFVSADEEVEVKPIRFAVRIPGCEEPACRRQLPLQLAWAISIHKSQGLTLDAVEVSLERVFAEGQSYVALSRARNLSSLRVLAFDPSVVKANAKVVKYYESIKENAEEEDDDSFLLRKRSCLS
ncbi:unnamed protein product [Cylicocyclus nassatus]|uniref:ATP-dependent DNA helicase PIF1 n=1 Tax=Cylicocyclus nassatus TaxID=53992 RepID=A0AA36MCD0_CYLNA|nr:unnamed protein product [Cylicocyclus nassatus]